MPGGPPSVDLSKARKLKDVEFRLYAPRVGWINKTLQTAKSENLRQITLFSSIDPRRESDETARPEWQNLDHLLVQLWTTRSIRPALTYQKGWETSDFVVPSEVLPELTRRGILDLI